MQCNACTVLHGLVDLQVEKAPLESYADVGGLEQQVIEIKEAVELPLTHPELYQDIGIKPPKVGRSLFIAYLLQQFNRASQCVSRCQRVCNVCMKVSCSPCMWQHSANRDS